MVSREEQKMKFESLNPWGLAAVIAFLVVGPCDLSAQEAATALSSIQQSAAKSALCSAIASKFPNPAAAGPSALSDPGVLSTAASSFAGSTHLPLPSAYGHDKGVCDAARYRHPRFVCHWNRNEWRDPANTWCKRLNFYSETTRIIPKWSEM
jgi:hypothetical protein